MKSIKHQHRNNYRWSNMDRSRLGVIRVNVELATAAVEFKRNFVEDNNKVKIAPGISHTVYPS